MEALKASMARLIAIARIVAASIHVHFPCFEKASV
jgi:hypothetical protein